MNKELGSLGFAASLSDKGVIATNEGDAMRLDKANEDNALLSHLCENLWLCVSLIYSGSIQAKFKYATC